MLVIFAAFCASLAFGRAIHAPFQFDDIRSIPRNATIRSLAPDVALRPPPGISVSGRPIANYSLAISHAIGGLEPAAYRVGNIALHALSAVLLLLILRSALGSRVVAPLVRDRSEVLAAGIATVWLVHPLQTDAVDYAIQRTEILVSFFYLATLYFAQRAWFASTQRSEAGWSIAAIAACMLGMGSKEVMATAPLAVLLYDRTFLAESFAAIRARRSRIWLHAGLFTTLGFLALVAWGARSDTVGVGELSWHQYLLSQGWAIPRYLRLVVWPDTLTFDYGMRAQTGPAAVVGLALLTLAGGAALWWWRRAPWVAYWALWFFLLLAPSSSFVPIQTEIAAERRMYLALAPILVLLAVAILVALERRRMPTSPRAIAITAAALVAAFTFRTARRSGEYHDPALLWAGSIATVPGNARAYDNLAAVRLARDPRNAAEAASIWRRALAVDSTYIPAWTNLAEVTMQQGRDDEARGLLERALRINPRAVDATLRYGGVLLKLGRAAESIPYLERATRANPTEDGLVTLALAYMEAGRAAEAIGPLRRVVAANPRRLDAAANLGVLLATHDRPGEAIPLLETAVAVDTGNGGMLALLARAYASQGRPNEAFASALRASSRSGLDAATFRVLGETMLLLNRPADARQMFGEARRLTR